MDGRIAARERQSRAARARDLARVKRRQFLEVLLKQGSFIMAPEARRETGVNEYYASCRLRSVADSFDLAAVRPVALSGDSLLVELKK
jgi:hypothetical protein